MQIIYFVPTHNVPFEIKIKLWNALKHDYHVPAAQSAGLSVNTDHKSLLYLTLIGRLF